MQTRDQQLAAAIFPIFDRYRDQPSLWRRRYGSLCHKLPVLIRTTGLVQALAFVALGGAGDKPSEAFLNDLAHTLGYKTNAAYLKASRDAQLFDYMLLTERTLDALLWYKRYTQSILKVEASEAGDELPTEEGA